MSIIGEISKYLTELIGSTATIVIEDVITYLSGISLGLVFGILVVSWATLRVHIDRGLDKEVAVMYVSETDSYATNPKLFWEHVEGLLVIGWWKLTNGKKKRHYLTLRQARRIRIIIAIFVALVAIFTLLGAMLTFNILRT